MKKKPGKCRALSFLAGSQEPFYFSLEVVELCCVVPALSGKSNKKFRILSTKSTRTGIINHSGGGVGFGRGSGWGAGEPLAHPDRAIVNPSNSAIRCSLSILLLLPVLIGGLVCFRLIVLLNLSGLLAGLSAAVCLLGIPVCPFLGPYSIAIAVAYSNASSEDRQ